MLEYDRIDISEGIDFKYESYLCNGCHDLMQKATSFNNIAIDMLRELLTEFIFGI